MPSLRNRRPTASVAHVLVALMLVVLLEVLLASGVLSPCLGSEGAALVHASAVGLLVSRLLCSHQLSPRFGVLVVLVVVGSALFVALRLLLSLPDESPSAARSGCRLVVLVVVGSALFVALRLLPPLAAASVARVGVRLESGGVPSPWVGLVSIVLGLVARSGVVWVPGLVR